MDKHLGEVRRELHIGLIDYITTYDAMRVIESKFMGTLFTEPSIVQPDHYAYRFQTMVERDICIN